MNPLANDLVWASHCIRKMIELPKPPNAPGNLTDSVFVTEDEVKQILAGIKARHEKRDRLFAEFAERITR